MLALAKLNLASLARFRNTMAAWTRIYRRTANSVIRDKLVHKFEATSLPSAQITAVGKNNIHCAAAATGNVGQNYLARLLKLLL
jgi:hypothetical protein